MGGAIDFETGGSGTTFTVTLPLAAPLADPSSGDADPLPSRRPRPKIAIITADAFDEDRRACMEAGCDDFLAKPLTPRGLSELLARLARLRTAEGDDHDDRDHGGDAGPDLDARPTQIAAST